MEIMQRLNKETGTAFVFATHDPRVMSFVRRVVTMRDGRMVDAGLTAEEVVVQEVDAMETTAREAILVG